jgi:SAM-dependent methyltransferase/organic radical activating enzyme
LPLQLANIEVNVVEHCNLRCYACDHAAPLLPPRFASVERVAEDLTALARVARAHELRLLGGEPLLHPALTEILEAARRAAIADRIVLVTNGVLLHQASSETWSRIDRLWLSVYPGVRPGLTREHVADACRVHGVELLTDIKDAFYLTQLNTSITDRWTIETVFAHCKSAHEWSCHTVHEGHYYKCPTAALLPTRLRQRGVAFAPHPADGVPLAEANLEGRLAAYLAAERPLGACAWCLGTSGPPVPARQLDAAGLDAWAREDHRGLIAEVAASLARGPGERLAHLTVPIRSTPGRHAARWLRGARDPVAAAPRSPVAQLLHKAPAALRSALGRAAASGLVPGLVPRLVPGLVPESVPGLVPESVPRPVPARASYGAALRQLRAHLPAMPARPEVLAEVAAVLFACGERDLALGLSDRLSRLQHADGSWPDGIEGIPSLGATARAVSGLAAAACPSPGVEHALRLGLAWLLGHLPQPPGPFPAWARWWPAEEHAAAAHLAAMVAVAKARARLGQSVPEDEVRQARQSGARLAQVLLPARPSQLWSHAHVEAPRLLLELGVIDEAAAWMARAERRQREDGSLPVWPGVTSACPICLAHAAAAWSMLGRLTAARHALGYLGARHAPPPAATGGRLNPRLRTAPEQIASAAAFLDSFHVFLRTSFDAQVDRFEDDTDDEKDGRLAFLARAVGDLGGARVLDAGCGRGALARALARRFPAAQIWGVDHSAAMLAHLPPQIARRQGSIQDLPFEDGSFDLVCCVEALEHACNPAGAVAELCRVARPGGLVVIIDKNVARSGALAIESWEQWFHREEVEAWLRPTCDPVCSEEVPHAPDLGPGLFLGWSGRRRLAGSPTRPSRPRSDA